MTKVDELLDPHRDGLGIGYQGWWPRCGRHLRRPLALSGQYLAGEGAFESRAHLNALAGELLVDTLCAAEGWRSKPWITSLCCCDRPF